MGSPLDELLPAVDIEGRAGDRRVRHEVDGQCGDVGRADDAPDRQRRAELLATRVQLVAQDRRRQRRVDEPAAIRFTRMGASSSARFFVRAGRAAVSAEMNASPTAVRRPPVPPMKSRVPPGRTLPAAFRATCSGSKRWASTSRRALSTSNSASGA